MLFGVKRLRQRIRRIAALFLSAFSLASVAAENNSPVSFKRDVAPILVQKCLGCHNAEKAKGNYRLHTFEELLRPGSSRDTPITPGQPRQSRLFQLISARDENDRMPQNDDALPTADIELVRRWINEGAKYDAANPGLLLVTLAPPAHPKSPEVYPVAVPITALAFHPNGETLAASGYHEITIWDSHSGKLARRIPHVAQRTLSLAYSSDGSLLAAASGTPGRVGEVKLFNAASGDLVRTLATIGDLELCVCFSPDGKRLAAGGADNAIRVWDVGSGKQELVIEQHADWILGLAFDPSGTMLASASRDKTARVFDARTGEGESSYQSHGEAVLDVAWRNTNTLCSVGRDRKIHVWSVKDAKKIAEFSGWDADAPRLLVADESIFTTCFDRNVREHSIEKKELLRTLSGHRDVVYALASHSPSARLITGSYDGEVRVWNLKTGELLLKFFAAPGLRGDPEILSASQRTR